ncbi:MAG: GNAT family N-acetyltransferase, partial [Anaerolineales bacterium]|nr:GNAT family N-acetyltransferase [Anaerolineales bacterium]
GIGRRLMNHLVEQAVAQGIRFFDAHVLPSNGSMVHLFNSSGRLLENHLSYGAREMRLQLGTEA